MARLGRKRAAELNPSLMRTADEAKDGAADSSGGRPLAVARPPAAEGCVQLALDATIIGPGMRTEDLYEPGTKLKIKGERGIFTYRYASVSRAGLVSLHVAGDHTFRAVRPGQVTPLRKARGK